jgi:predicted  nucleic acid-binding Zn-ribbon protein
LPGQSVQLPDNAVGGGTSLRKAQLLAELQHVDTTLDRAGERLAAVERQLADRSTLAAIESEHDTAESGLQRELGRQRDLELEVQDLRDKLGGLEKKLYSGTVANPKELDSMAKEAQQLRGLINGREDRLLEVYDAAETASSQLAGIAARLETARAQHAENQRSLTTERDDLRSNIAEYERRRTSLAADLDAQSVRIYEGLRRSRNGLAVAEVTQRTCQGCRITLPANEEIRARASEDLVFCQSCGRILHAGL